MKKLTANLIVESIEDGQRFWVDRLGFEKTTEVPHEGRLGFVILKRGTLELRLQRRASLKGGVPPIAGGPHGTVLFCEVDDLNSIRKALGGLAPGGPRTHHLLRPPRAHHERPRRPRVILLRALTEVAAPRPSLLRLARG
jgi:hypothetical protein